MAATGGYTPCRYLRELCAKKIVMPKYDLLASEGRVTFIYKVSASGLSATGNGKSIKEAKHNAAKRFLEQIVAADLFRDWLIPAKTKNEALDYLHNIIPDFAAYDGDNDDNSVQLLFEMCHYHYWPPPRYVLTDERGLSRDKIFTITCFLRTFKQSGSAKNKRLAKRFAAEKMLKFLNEEEGVVEEEAQEGAKPLKIYKVPYDTFHNPRFFVECDALTALMTPNESASFIDAHCSLEDILVNNDLAGYEALKTSFRDFWSPNCKGCVTSFCRALRLTENKTIGYNQLLEQNPDIYATVGCHPLDFMTYEGGTEGVILSWAVNPKVVAVGEIGLDYSRPLSSIEREYQKLIFERQVLSAIREINKPLLLHCRDAEDDLIAVLKRVVAHDYSMHLHNFRGSEEAFKKFAYFPNLSFGVSTDIFNETSHDLDFFYRDAPLQRLLLESSSPNNLPNFLKSTDFGSLTINVPGMAGLVGLKLAEIRKIEPKTVFETVLSNTRKFYGR